MSTGGGGRAVVIRTYPQEPADDGGPTAPARAGPRSSEARSRSGPPRPLSAVVLAAGEGTRMRSARPKPLHRLCGRPMVLHVLDALAELPVTRVVVVVGHRADWVTKTLVEHAPPGLAIEFVEQREAHGTGDAMSVALTGLPDDEATDDGDVVVLPGDTPLLRPLTARGAGAGAPEHRSRRDPPDRGRSTTRPATAGWSAGGTTPSRGSSRTTDATPEERAVREVNTSIYCFKHVVLAPTLRRLSPSNAQGEYYLTDRGRRPLRGGPQGRFAGRRGHRWRSPASTTVPSWRSPRRSCATGSTSGGCGGA